VGLNLAAFSVTCFTNMPRPVSNYDLVTYKRSRWRNLETTDHGAAT